MTMYFIIVKTQYCYFFTVQTNLDRCFYVKFGNLEGRIIDSERNISYSKCKDICTQEFDCLIFTYVFNSKECFLKSAEASNSEAPVINDYYVSGQKICKWKEQIVAKILFHLQVASDLIPDSYQKIYMLSSSAAAAKKFAGR